MLTLKEKCKLLVFSAGIFLCYCAFGIIQERIFKVKYENGEKKENFTYSVTFVSLQTAFYAFFSYGISRYQKRDWLITHKNENLFLPVSIFYVTSMVSSIMSLQWISYPTQVVTKAAKPIVVMFLSVLIAKKSYSLQKYVIVILIVGSISVFLLDSQQEHPNADNKIGLALVIGSLLLDGVTGATQDRVRSISKPSTFEFMYYVNYFSFWMLTCVMAFTGEGKEFIQFCMTFPLVLAHISIAIFFGIFGQYFMSAIVSNFGALPCSLVTTIRKFFTVLFSVLSFDNSLSTVQWISTSVIFLSLFVDVIYSKKSTKSNSMTPQSGVINLTFDSVVICDDKIDESKKSEDNNNINNSDNMYIITR